MSEIAIKYNPPAVRLLLMKIEQEMKFTREIRSCHKNPDADVIFDRGVHTLKILGGCHSLKIKLKIKYLVDSSIAWICINKDQLMCTGGVREYEYYFPEHLQYWSGARKQSFTKYICWAEDHDQPILNVTQEFNIEIVSQDLEPDFIKSLDKEAILCAECERII
jgi:hypothetical protein